MHHVCTHLTYALKEKVRESAVEKGKCPYISVGIYLPPSSEAAGICGAPFIK